VVDPMPRRDSQKRCQRKNELRKTLALHRRRLSRAWQQSVYPLFLEATDSFVGPPDATYFLTRMGESIWSKFVAPLTQSEQSGD
jgi:hypothetical protein